MDARFCFGTRCQLRQMLRSTSSNKGLSFRILAMFGGFDKTVILSSKVGADEVVHKLLKTVAIREAIRRSLVHPRN